MIRIDFDELDRWNREAIFAGKLGMTYCRLCSNRGWRIYHKPGECRSKGKANERLGSVL